MLAKRGEFNGKHYIDLTEGLFRLASESDLNDILGLCYEFDADHVLISHNNLAPEFYDLRSGLAGAAMQKFANYRTRVALVMDPDSAQGERMQELIYEMNKGSHFRFFTVTDEARQWLVS